MYTFSFNWCTLHLMSSHVSNALGIGTATRLNTHFLYISNLVAKAPDFKLDKKLRNLLSNRWALNYGSQYFEYFFPSNAIQIQTTKF